MTRIPRAQSPSIHWELKYSLCTYSSSLWWYCRSTERSILLSPASREACRLSSLILWTPIASESYAVFTRASSQPLYSRCCLPQVSTAKRLCTRNQTSNQYLESIMNYWSKPRKLCPLIRHLKSTHCRSIEDRLINLKSLLLIWRAISRRGSCLIWILCQHLRCWV